jgi:hypothetical protein
MFSDSPGLPCGGGRSGVVTIPAMVINLVPDTKLGVRAVILVLGSELRERRLFTARKEKTLF